jgi:hypothetical protein
MRKLFLVVVASLALAGCFRHAAAPTGRWEGTYEADDIMIVARVEVVPGGAVRVSAPNYTDLEGATEEQKNEIRGNLASGLADGWGQVPARRFDFDGHDFRKPGGIAPQMTWDSATKQMTLIVYLGTHPAIDIPLHAKDDFSDNPWFD